MTDVVNANAATHAVVSSYQYTLDADGKRLSVTDNTGATTTYGYDADSRLTSETTPGGTTSYTYDSVGNRLSKTSGGTTTTFTYDADDRNSSSAYTYNANGDVLNDGTHTYSYDFEDHLTGSGTQTTQTATYAYDADGTRIQKIDGTGTTNYLVDSNRTYAEVLEERDASGNVLARYDYGDDLIRMDRGSVSRYYLFDGLGSTRQLTDGTGAVTDTYAYDAFGNLTSQTGSTVNPYLFNGQEQDAGTGLYYLRARYMNPQDGRFISQDPFGGDNEDPISLHRYLYVSANPLNEVDPSGKEGIGDTLATIGISAIVGATLGASSVFAVGGNLEQAAFGAFYGAEGAAAVALAISNELGPASVISGLIGGLASLTVIEIVGEFDPKHAVTAPAAALALLGGFASSALSAAVLVPGGLNGFQSALFKAGLSFDITTVTDLIKIYTDPDSYKKKYDPALYAIVDGFVSAVFSYLKTTDTNTALTTLKELNPQFDPNGLTKFAFQTLTQKQVFGIGQDIASKLLQVPVKAFIRMISSLNPTIN